MKDALAVALVHFVWQGAVLAAVGWILMRLSNVPSVRYAIGVATMMAMLAAPVSTLVVLQSAHPLVTASVASPPFAPESRGIVGNNDGAGAEARSADTAVQGFSLPTTWILSLWVLGVGVLSLRLVGGLAMAHRVATTTVVPVGEDLQRLASQLAARLKMRGAVRVCESASVAVPVMIGWLRPVVVLPPAALAALPMAQLEALLAHEFAHIRRHDYLVNLLQTAVETICFYHPAVWWISRRVRLEREHCCDDVAVSVCDRLTYVTALSTLAALTTPRLAMAATGGSLRERVRRLIEPTTHSVTAKGGWMAMLPILLVVSLVAPQAWGTQSPGQVSTSRPDVVEPVSAAAKVRITEPNVAAQKANPLRVTVKPSADAAQVRVTTTNVTAPKANPLRVTVVPTQAAVGRKAVQSPLQPDVLKMRLAQVGVGRRVPEEEAAQSAEARQRAERAIALQKLELEQRRQAMELEAEMVTLEAHLRQEAAAVARQKELVERGLATEQTLAEAEARIAETQQRLEEAKRRGESAEQGIVLRRREAELERSLSSRQAVVQSGMAARSTPDIDSPVQPQDRLTIVVAGEPDLPTSFTVRADGSIRFPFLGVIRVQGSTARQVQSVIQKLIVDKGLAANPVVTVSIGRTLRRVR